MSRPCELLKARRCDGMTTGLPISNLTALMDKENKSKILQFEIISYKNQSSRLTSKKMWIKDARCPAERRRLRISKGRRCPCHYLRPFAFVLELLNRRRELVNKLLAESQPTSVKNKRKKKISRMLIFQ